MQYRQAVSTIESGIYVVDKILVESKIEKGSRETALQVGGGGWPMSVSEHPL